MGTTSINSTAQIGDELRQELFNKLAKATGDLALNLVLAYSGIIDIETTKVTIKDDADGAATIPLSTLIEKINTSLVNDQPEQILVKLLKII